jgi:hypothetical protein
MAHTGITIILQLDRHPDDADASPSGSARLPGGATRSFQGWLGLAEAIDQLTGAPIDPQSELASNDKENPR